MTPLGKALVFYLKYVTEMNRLYGNPTYYGAEEADLAGLGDAEQVQEKARAVGAVAYEQAADFLQLCGGKIKDHFKDLKIVTLANEKTRAFVTRNWDWGVSVCVSSVPDGCFSCGVFVAAPPKAHTLHPKDVYGEAVPWLWSKGGHKGADAIWNVVGSWVHSHGGGRSDDYKGMVTLACIPIKAQPPESFDVDRDPLIAEVMNVIAQIGAEETKAIANFVAGLNAPDEGGTESQLAPSPPPP